MTPSMALGQTVHEVIESLSQIPVEKRFSESLLTKLDRSWQNITGEKGGFQSESEEERYKKRAEKMLAKIIKNPGPLANLAVKIKSDLPHFWLSQEENLILCGRIDWIEYIKDNDAVHIIDFKTSKSAEKPESLQLPIYYLLVSNLQKRKVAKISYWYLEFNDKCEEQKLPDPKESMVKILKIAKQIKLARTLSRFKCPEGEKGCRYCTPLERIIKGEAKYVGVNSFNQDTFIFKDHSVEVEDDSLIL